MSYLTCVLISFYYNEYNGVCYRDSSIFCNSRRMHSHVLFELTYLLRSSSKAKGREYDIHIVLVKTNQNNLISLKSI